MTCQKTKSILKENKQKKQQMNSYNNEEEFEINGNESTCDQHKK